MQETQSSNSSYPQLTFGFKIIQSSAPEMDVLTAKKEEVELERQSILQRLEALPQESRQLHDNLENLDEQDKKLDSEMAHLKNESNPILCLPNEITCHIFEITRIQSESNYDHPRYELWPPELELRPEIMVSRVCQHWRQVALSYPTIWSHIVIRNWFVGQAVSSAQRLSVYLTRSQGAPLDIVVTIKAPPYAQEPVSCTGALREFLLAVLPHSTRWQRLVIWIESQWNMFPLSSLGKIAVPQLEVFEIGSWPMWNPYIPSSPSHVPDFLTLFEFGAPKLASVLTSASLRIHHHCRTISTIYLQRAAKPQPWEQFVALMNLPNLTNLTLDGWIFSAPGPASDRRRIVAPSLRHFRLGCRIVVQHMWDTLSAPHLELLLLFNIWGLDIFNSHDAFPGGLFPVLNTLALWDFEVASTQDLLHLAFATPQATDLIICSCTPDSTFMMSLYEQSLAKNTQLWPHLETFSYVLGNDLWFTGNTSLATYTYEAVRKVLLRFVDWRLVAFGRECAFWIDYPNYSDPATRRIRHNDPFLYVPEFDDSKEERALWQKHLMPRNRRIFPWPDEQTIHFGYHEQVRFGNAFVRD